MFIKDFKPFLRDFSSFYIEKFERTAYTDEAKGSGYYMALEATDGRIGEICPEINIYSLGKVLYFY